MATTELVSVIKGINKTMDSIKKISLDKNRGYTACVSAAHKMFFDNFKTIFKRMWLYSLPLAFSVALLIVVVLSATLNGASVATLVWNIVADVLIIGSGVAYMARLMTMLNGRAMKFNVRRNLYISLTYVLFSLVMTFLLGIVSYFLGNKALVIAQIPIPYSFLFSLAAIVIIPCLLLPFTYGVMKYLMEPDSKYSTIFSKSYKTGMRYWGLIFVVLFLATLCTFVVLMLISLPCVITMVANLSSLIGVKEYGDPSGLPQWFAFMQFCICTLATFIALFVNVFWVFAVYFMYGSIETRLKEKEEYLKAKV